MLFCALQIFSQYDLSFLIILFILSQLGYHVCETATMSLEKTDFNVASDQIQTNTIYDGVMTMQNIKESSPFYFLH